MKSAGGRDVVVHSYEGEYPTHYEYTNGSRLTWHYRFFAGKLQWVCDKVEKT